MFGQMAEQGSGREEDSCIMWLNSSVLFDTEYTGIQWILVRACFDVAF